ncbi:anthranilate synthase component I [Egicoccus halophilus]|uniref:Anthranilate synthase component 1 n=1 Tax=Egicoccus halophilus TaxID=1670830 RepID=A0A8J3ESX1_9ACTN|nr:anthranilate synthase component I [Egicoccus halophilus]GGI04395.1 anthranilate synthase component I [Egicoccus halophilus]
MTVRPDRAEFVRLAAEHGVVPVYREVLSDLHTPLSVYARLAGQGPSFLLESAEHGERWGRYSFVGIDPFLVLHGRDGQVTWEGTPPAAAADASGPLDALAKVTEALSAPSLLDVPLHGGAVGYLGYDAVREVERIPDTGRDELGLPDVTMLFPRHVVALDHLRQVLTVVTNVVVDAVDAADLEAAYDAAVQATDAVVAQLSDAPTALPAAEPPDADVRPADVPSNLELGGYQRMVEAVKEYVAAGDTFQTVVSQRFSVPTEASAFDVYRVLRVINPSPYLYLLDLGPVGGPDRDVPTQIVGSSPEALVQVQGRHVETWPIAGTRPRGETPAEDRQHEQDLLADAKERAEHVMLVDLARNDLGRVCDVGSVRVDDLMHVERYSHVMHLVSSVTGTLEDGLGPVDVLRAVFPAGTVSGAPKVRAMEIIDELEPTRRGPYAGAIGYVDFAGNLDTCITIRTVVLQAGQAHVQAGAGIVADSRPDAEERETRSKAGAVLAAVRAAEALTAPGQED